MTSTVDSPRVSVAIPVYNEEENLAELVSRVGAVLDGLPGTGHELLLVDDGSVDATPTMLEQLAATDSRIVVVSLSRNFGHQAAVSCAIDHARGDVIVLMDGDLQDRPEAIPDFIERYRQGYDVVYAIRTDRKEGILKRASYQVFYRLMRLTSDISIPQQAGDFGLISAEVARQMRALPERNRYNRGLRSWVGFKQIGVAVERDARYAGQPKYGLRRLIALSVDGIFSFSVAPLRAATIAGLFLLIGTTAYTMFAVYAKIVLGQSPQGFTTLIVFQNFLAGMQLTFLGVIGEYIGRIYDEVKQRPHYVVQRITGDRS